MTADERWDLLHASIPEDWGNPGSPRYAFRVGPRGIEWFVARLTRFVDEQPEFHGYPTDRVPSSVLGRFRDAGRLDQLEYRRQVKEVGE